MNPNISITNKEYESVRRTLQYPEWSQLSTTQRRTAVSTIYADRKDPESRSIYTLLSTGNPNANDFEFEIVMEKPKPRLSLPLLAGVGLLIYLVTKN